MRILAPGVVALASLGVATSPHLVQTDRTRSTNNGIKWTRCKPYEDIPAECGIMAVPLDYTDDKSSEIDIQLVRIPAQKKPSRGSVFVNFGGPGISGILDLPARADRMMAATGGHYDLVNVVPRGSNDTLSFSCYANPSFREPDVIISSNASDVALGETWSRAAMFAENCATFQNDTGRFIGTAFVARDTLKAVEKLEDDKMLRFWGISYGTVLGSTILGMFPEKVDKMVLDGVINPVEYYKNEEIEFFSSTDDVFRGFCSGCVENPETCPIAGNLTSKQLEESLVGLFEHLKYNPIPAADPNRAGGGILVDYSYAKSSMIQTLYDPATWPSFAKQLADIMNGKVPEPATEASHSAQTAGLRSDGSSFEAQLGIKCSDALTYAEKIEDILPIIEGRRNMSQFLGDAVDQTFIRCSRWRMPAKERFDAGWDHIHTKNDVLLINNRYDPVASIASARAVSQILNNSVLLEQNAYGHSTLVQGSLCTAKALRAYFEDGLMPEEGTVCDDMEVSLFSGESGWEEVIEALK